VDYRVIDLDIGVGARKVTHHVGLDGQDAPVPYRAAEWTAVVNLAGNRVDDRANERVDGSAATSPALRAAIEQAEGVHVVPVPIEPMPRG
jgi:hypothetical protein